MEREQAEVGIEPVMDPEVATALRQAYNTNLYRRDGLSDLSVRHDRAGKAGVGGRTEATGEEVVAAREQGTLFTVRENHNSVSVDVNDAAAKRVKAYRPAERLVFAQSVAALLGIPVEENALINIGKRGVSNAGFRVVLWKEKGEQA